MPGNRNAYGKQKVDEAYDAHRQRVADMVSEIGDHLGDTADKLTGGKGVSRGFSRDHDDEEMADDEEMDRRDRGRPNFRMNQEPFERVRKGWSEFGKHRRDRWKKLRQRGELARARARETPFTTLVSATGFATTSR